MWAPQGGWGKAIGSIGRGIMGGLNFANQALGVAGKVMPYFTSAKAYERSLTGGREQRAMQIEQAQKQMDFQERMSNTAYQRSMGDMKEAGLNPILAYKMGGASSPGGAMAPIQDIQTPAVSTAANVFSQTQSGRLYERQRAKVTEEIKLVIEQTAKTREEVEVAKAIADKTLEEVEKVIEEKNLIGAQITNVDLKNITEEVNARIAKDNPVAQRLKQQGFQNAIIEIISKNFRKAQDWLTEKTKDW